MGIRDMVNAGRYRVPTQFVPTATVVHDRQGRFAFEIPWPWFESDGHFEQQPVPQDGHILLFAPRTTDPWPQAMIRTADEASELDDATVKSESRRLAQSLEGKARRSHRLIIGGEPAVDFFVECRDAVTHLVMIAAGELTVFAEFLLPRDGTAAYEIHMETMLATWRWT